MQSFRKHSNPQELSSEIDLLKSLQSRHFTINMEKLPLEAFHFGAKFSHEPNIFLKTNVRLKNL